MKTLIISEKNQKGIVVDMTKKEVEKLSFIPKEIQIAELEQKLADTDYIACKIAEGVATKEEYAEVIAQRQAWREEINKLENTEGEIL